MTEDKKQPTPEKPEEKKEEEGPFEKIAAYFKGIDKVLLALLGVIGTVALIIAAILGIRNQIVEAIPPSPTISPTPTLTFTVTNSPTNTPTPVPPTPVSPTPDTPTPAPPTPDPPTPDTPTPDTPTPTPTETEPPPTPTEAPSTETPPPNEGDPVINVTHFKGLNIRSSPWVPEELEMLYGFDVPDNKIGALVSGSTTIILGITENPELFGQYWFKIECPENLFGRTTSGCWISADPIYSEINIDRDSIPFISSRQ